MAAIVDLNDQNWREIIGDKPALLIFSNGEGLRGDFDTAYKKSAAKDGVVVFGRINPETNPELQAAFNVGSKPLMVAYYKNDILVRNQRPWGSDVVLAVELLENKYREDKPIMTNNTPAQNNAAFDGKPFVVTDQTFQQEVIDYSKELPVLVDFWAEWCGPCRMVAPIMEKLAADYAGQVRIAKVDTDANPGLSQAFRIMSIPTIMAFKDGKLVFNQPGAFPEEAFRDLLRQLIELELPADEEETTEEA